MEVDICNNKDIINYMMASNLTGSFKDLKTYVTSKHYIQKFPKIS